MTTDLPTILRRVPLEDLLAEVRRRRDLIDVEESAAELRVKSAHITRACAQAWALPPAALWRPGRPLATTQPRQAAMVLLRDLLGMTYDDIARVFAKDTATAIHAHTTQPSRMTDPRYAEKFRAAQALLTLH